MQTSNHELNVCDFVREIIASRIGEAVHVVGSPEQTERSKKTVEQLWQSDSHLYAVELTRIEAFEGQIANQELAKRFLTPVRNSLANVLPGTFVFLYSMKDLAAVRAKYPVAQDQIRKAVLEASLTMAPGETRELDSEALHLPFRLHRRDAPGSQIFLRCLVEGESDSMRLDRLKRALAAKLPKLQEAADGRTSVLALEADDHEHSNMWLVAQALGEVLTVRDDQPDVVVLVETDSAPWSGWVLKDGNRTGNDVPTPNGGYCYTQGQIGPLRRGAR